jgi:3-oxoacyl-(acyl-carrier-protein) synthase
VNDFHISAASYLGPEGYGNDRTGLRRWPAALEESLRRGELGGLHWSMLFESDPSRFARMDLMCRLGLMATELLDAGFETMGVDRREGVGVIVESCAGSIVTDLRFLRTPRPSLFTYTLPSTLIGEICIRYGLKGPVLCLVSAESASLGALWEGRDWLGQGLAGDCLCVVCEALDGESSRTMATAALGDPGAWHAAALWLSQREGRLPKRAVAPGAVVQVCRALCGVHPP